MNAVRQFGIFMILIVIICLYPGQILSQITTGSLLNEMADLRNLSYYPELSYKTIQFSSHDRRSKLPGGPGWFANSDGFGNEPVPNFQEVLQEPDKDDIGRYLICDIDGPGAVVRTWTAAINGTVEVFLDGSNEPIISTEATEFFKQPYATFLEEINIPKDLFLDTYSQRDAGYFPIPFADNLRIEWEGELRELHFYELEVRIYEPGTKVQSFQPADLRIFAKEIRKTAGILSDPDGNMEYSRNRQVVDIAATVEPTIQDTLIHYRGGGAVEKLALRIQADDIEKALRQSILEISFDGHSRPQVLSPLGDFFGAAPGINPYASLPFSVKPEGEMICRFVMPFRNSVTVQVNNMGDQNIRVNGESFIADYNWNDTTSMHFRAHWRVGHNLNNSEVFDLPFLCVRGRGSYVGTTSMLYNPSSIPTPYGNWWGEGDEKIFIDDDTFPSFFGTGSEDYYNYSWSSPEIWLTPYAGQPRNDGPGNRGFVSNYRWHILDPVPFRDQLQFYMEMFSHQPTDSISYARISYYYAIPGAIDDHLPISTEDIRDISRTYWTPVAEFGASNSEFYQAETLLPTGQNFDLVRNNLWADGSLWVWLPQRNNSRIDFIIRIETSSTYRIHFTTRRSPDSGKFSVFLDEKPLHLNGSEILDLNQPYRTISRNISSGDLDLKKGSHEITLRNASEESGKEIGIDFIWIQKRN